MWYRAGLISFLLVCSLVCATEMEVSAQYASFQTLPSLTKTLLPQQRADLFRRTRNHPVAALEVVWKYDPSEEIGFCFGRAMTAHLLARKLGLDAGAIKKLFIVGDLRQGPEPEWRFHVTTLVRGEDQEWYAIDPIMEPPLAVGGPILVEQWMEIVQKTWDKENAAQFYLVDPQTILPDLRDVPSPAEELGTHLIEIKFKPASKTGFTKKRFGSFPIWDVSEEAQRQFFATVNSETENRFRFLGLTVNDQYYDYRHYFEDLLKNLAGDFGKESPRTQTAFQGKQSLGSSKNLHSPRVKNWFR